MRKIHLRYLACPECKHGLGLAEVTAEADGVVESGALECPECRRRFPILRHIPRFVPRENYASGFGLEWTKHARTQYDSYSGAPISETRFFGETKWQRSLVGETILEVGSGSGRFTEQAASTGAMVISLDFSYAVEANFASNGAMENVLIVQGDVYRMPFREAQFDKLFCFGMLQHTPDVKKSFMALPKYLRSGGSLVVDVYRKNQSLSRFLFPRRYVQPFTRRIPPRLLYFIVEAYVSTFWPVLRQADKVRWLRRRVAAMLMIADYRGRYDLSEEMLREWAVLDTFDGLAPAYDSPQTIETLRSWFREAKLREVEVNYGYNGIEGRGVRH